MENKSVSKKKREVKRKMSGLIVVLIAIGALSVGGAKGWSNLAKEHDEAKNLPLNAVDFSKLNDGTYIGKYEGGMYKWRANEIQATVSGGKVTDIKILQHKENQKPEFTDKLFDRVLKTQSLQVDTISGATLTSKAYLQGVENALVKAVKS